MSVLSDRWIKKMALEKEMIKPFFAKQKTGKNILYGEINGIGEAWSVYSHVEVRGRS